MEPMGDELRSNGLEVIGGTKGDPEHEKADDYFRYDEIKDTNFDPEVGAVIQGIDFAVTYSKLAIASIYIQRGAKWIVTNDDAYTM